MPLEKTPEGSERCDVGEVEGDAVSRALVAVHTRFGCGARAAGTVRRDDLEAAGAECPGDAEAEAATPAGHQRCPDPQVWSLRPIRHTGTAA